MTPAEYVYVFTCVAGVLGAVTALRQYALSARWRRAEFVSEFVRRFEAKPEVVDVMRLLDWNQRPIEWKVGGRRGSTEIDDDMLATALDSGTRDERYFEDYEIHVRDVFDRFLTELDRLEVAIQAGLVTAEEFDPYIRYWIEILSGRRIGLKSAAVLTAIWEFIDDYRYDGVQSLFRRYGYDIRPPLQLQPGDVFFTRGGHFISRLIRRLTTRIGDSEAPVNHVGVVVEGGSIHDARVVEAVDMERVKERNLWDSYADGTEVAVFRLNLSDGEQEAVVKAARARLGNSYGGLKLLAHLLDWTLRDRFVFRRLAVRRRTPICSSLVAECFAKCSVLNVNPPFGVPVEQASPAHIWTGLNQLSNSSYVEEVRALSPLVYR